jgi:hypothetical protein
MQAVHDMDLIKELVKPVVVTYSRGRWFGASIVVGFFLGFLDTLMLAALMGYMGITVPAYFGVPTTLTGYFLSGMILGGLAPLKIVWEIPCGILVCALLMVLGLFGLRGHGVLAFMFNFGLIPAIAVGVCYLGVLMARGQLKKKSTVDKSNTTVSS